MEKNQRKAKIMKIWGHVLSALGLLTMTFSLVLLWSGPMMMALTFCLGAVLLALAEVFRELARKALGKQAANDLVLIKKKKQEQIMGYILVAFLAVVVLVAYFSTQFN